MRHIDQDTSHLVSKALRLTAKGRLQWNQFGSFGAGYIFPDFTGAKGRQAVTFRVGDEAFRVWADQAVWVLAHGAWLENPGHLNGDMADHRLSNLFCDEPDPEAQPALDAQDLDEEGAAGVWYERGPKTGVDLEGNAVYADLSKPWRARITVKGERYALGSFRTQQEARIAYQTARLMVRKLVHKDDQVVPPSKAALAAKSAKAKKLPGAYFDTSRGRWSARLSATKTAPGRFIGYFATEVEAHEAWKAAKATPAAPVSEAEGLLRHDEATGQWRVWGMRGGRIIRSEQAFSNRAMALAEAHRLTSPLFT